MLNKKFLTKLLGDEFRKRVMSQHHKYIESRDLKLKQYATYVVDKHKKERNLEMKDLRAAYYGYSPVDVLAYVAKDSTIKKSLFEFNSVNHFLVKDDHKRAVEVVTCILVQLVHENKKDIAVFDIDKIDADAKKLEDAYMKEMKTKNDG